MNSPSELTPACSPHSGKPRAAYGTFAEVDKPTSSAKGDFGWHKVGDGVALAAGNHTMKVMKEATTRGAAILDAFYLTAGNEAPVEK